MILLIVIMIITTVLIVIVIIVIVIIVIVILVIVFLVMLVIVLKNNVYVDSSVCEKVFNFLLGGRSINNSTREWKDLFKCQMISGAYSDTPFLVVTATLLQSIIPIAIGQQWSSIGSNRIVLLLYSLWNHSKCSVGNVYIPTKKHSLQV